MQVLFLFSAVASEKLGMPDRQTGAEPTVLGKEHGTGVNEPQFGATNL
jgi:hypothetical protein